MSSFGVGEQPTTSVPTSSLPVSAPLILSETPSQTDIEEARIGAKWLGLGIFEQGEHVARVMNAVGEDGHPLYDTVCVEMPRRSTKTTVILETLLGRCLCRPGYRVASTAQDGLRARQKLQEVMQALRAAGFEDAGLGKLYFSNGTEHIAFTNGSVWKALPPDGGVFRSDAFDAVLIDEAGELAPDKADALLSGILPTQDTRPDSQTIIAGTPHVEHRAGLLWDTLEDLENGAPGVGGVVYAARDTDTFADLSDPDNPVYDLDLLRRVHPGISCGLTTEAKILSRIAKMGLPKWCAEYLCQWPRNAGSSALDVEAWRDCAQEEMPERPERVGIAWDVDPDGQRAALVAAWRDDKGRAVLEVLDVNAGADWLPRKAATAQVKYRRQFAYDPIGQNLEVAETMNRPPHRVRLTPLKLRDMVGASARLEKEIHKRNVVHFDQPALNESVEGVTWRPAGKDGRLFARKASASSAAAVVAAAEALWIYDVTTPTGTGRRIISSVNA